MFVVRLRGAVPPGLMAVIKKRNIDIIALTLI